MTGDRSAVTEAAPQRLARLDGLRGLAAAVVAFAYHPRVLFAPELFTGHGPLLAWLSHWGWTFVDLFFLLSGYIFAHVYLPGDKLARPGAMAQFGVARIARLYPLHLLTLLVVALFAWGRDGNTGGAFAMHLAMLQNFVRPVPDTFNGPAWSLSVEACCYVLFAFAAMRGGGPRLAVVTALAIALGLGHLLVNGQAEGPWVADNLPRGLLGFFLGQVLWHARAALARVPSWLLWAGLTLGLVLPTGAWSSLLPLVLLGFPAALLLALRLPWLEGRTMRWLGDRSYAIYLIHLPVIAAAKAVLGPVTAEDPWVWPLYAGLIATILVLSDLTYRGYEMPARRWIRAAWNRRQSPAPAVPHAAA